MDVMRRSGEQDALRHVTRLNPKLEVHPDFPPSDPSHPGTYARFAHLDTRKCFGKQCSNSILIFLITLCIVERHK